MADSKDGVASAARILELENLLISRGIALPSKRVKPDHDASEVTDAAVSSPHPAQSQRSTSPNPRAKTVADGRARSKKGRQPVMSRSDRALCRIMRSHGKSYQDIATVMNQSMGIVGAAIKNSYLRPDDADRDYDFVDGQTKRKYPPKTLGKRAQIEGSSETPPAKQQKLDHLSSDTRSNTSEVTVEIPYNDASSSQGSTKTNDSVLDFLCKLDMEALHPKFQDAGVTNQFFVEFQSWEEKAAGELLEDLVNAGIMNRVQAFKVRKALCRI